MIDVREYNDRDGRSPYAAWFDQLNPQAAAKVSVAVTRLGLGNFRMSKASVLVSSNAGSRLAPVTECILGKKANQ